MTGTMAQIRRLFPPTSLRARLTVILFATFCAGLLAAFAFFYWEAIGTQSALQERSLQEQARELLGDVQLDQRGEPNFAQLRSLDSIYSRAGSGFAYTLFDRTGAVKATSSSRAGNGPLPLIQLPSAHTQFGPVFFVGPSRTAAMTARAFDGSFFLVVSRDNPDPQALAGSLIEQDATPLLILIPFVLITFVLIVVVINHMLRPLQRASSEAAHIGPTSLIARVNPLGLPSEIIPLVTTFNGALDRLSKAYQVEKRLTADAAHELRTPLAVLRMRLERARLDEKSSIDWAAVQRDFRQIDRLTGQLLDLARKEQGGGAIRKPEVNLARVAREASALMLPLVEETGRSLTILAPEAVRITDAAEDDLRDAVRNLIENAVVHGKGTITIEVDTIADHGRAYAALTVADEGPGVPKGLRTSAFERFRKGDSSTPGAGLGLAIVRHVAQSHGGEAGFVDGPRCVVRVTLPLSQLESALCETTP